MVQWSLGLWLLFFGLLAATGAWAHAVHRLFPAVRAEQLEMWDPHGGANHQSSPRGSGGFARRLREETPGSHLPN